MSRLNVLLVLVTCGLWNVAFSHNGEIIDSIIEARVSELGVTKVVVTFHDEDTSYTHEIKRYNAQGNVIELIVPLRWDFSRLQTDFDSLGRETFFRRYSKEDSTLVQLEQRWIYLDSNRHIVESYNSRKELFESNRYEVMEKDNAFWVYETKTSFPSKRSRKHLSKYSSSGDSLRYSEFVTYNKEGRMDDITAYYTLVTTDSIQKTRTQTEGSCYANYGNLEDSIYHIKTREAYLDFKERMINNQLKGKYPYELDEDIHTYKVYNFDGQLIQDGYGIFEMKTFEYNDQNQLVKIIHWGAPVDDHGIVETGETIIDYFSNGLPRSMERTEYRSKKSERFTFEYHSQK